MSAIRLKRTLAGALALAGVLCFCLGACDRPPSSSSSRPSGEPTILFTVRAKVEMIPQPGNPSSAFIIHHEPIDEFPNPDGTRGMNSMTMPIPLAKGVSIEGVNAGDFVEVSLAAWTTPGNLGIEARSIKKLPADTVLRFGKAAPALGPPTPGR